MAASDCDGSQRAWLAHFNHDGSQRWLSIWTMAASKLASTACCQPKSLRGYRHARSPQRVARTAGKSHSRLHFAHSHDLRRGLRAQPPNRALACIFAHSTRTISHRGLRAQPAKSHSRLISRTRHALLSVQCEVLCVGLCVCFYVCVCV